MGGLPSSSTSEKIAGTPTSPADETPKDLRISYHALCADNFLASLRKQEQREQRQKGETEQQAPLQDPEVNHSSSPGN